MSEPRVLVSYHTQPSYMLPMQVSSEQVNCGPFFEDAERDGRVISRRTPPGSYDMVSIVESLPVEQRPDLLVVKTDATRSNQPRNIAALGIPAILILGDTQHQERPVEGVLKYAVSERYTAYVAEYMRRHLHYFREAGLANVHWAPGLNLKDWGLDFETERIPRVAFVGQAGRFHPYRRRLLEQLKAAPDLPFAMGRAPQKEASEIYAKSLISLNFSMNGDMNLRIFEVLAAGGFLLTDRLQSQAGQAELFREGVHFETFGDYDELLGKIRHYLAHPQEAFRIAQRGHAEFVRSHSPARKRQQLLDLAFRGWIDPLWNGDREPRSRANRSRDPAHFFNRIRHYERFQTAQLAGASPTVVFSAGAEPALTSDLADLYRAHLWSLATHHRDYFRRAGVADQVGLREDPGALPAGTRVDTLVIAAAEVATPAGAELIAQLQPAELLVEDLTLIDPARQRSTLETLAGGGWIPDPAHPGSFQAPVLV